MTVLNAEALDKAGKKNAPLRAALAGWQAVAEAATWKSIADVRAGFPSADGVPVAVKGDGVVVVTVFNVKGNQYRLLTVVNYAAARVTVLEVLTHAAYSKERWKERL